METLPSLLAGVAFGLALAAPPGPMNAVIAEEAVTNGFLAGVRAGLGALSADAVFFVCSLLGVVGFVRRFPTVRTAMVGVGGLLMLSFAYGAATSARRGPASATPSDADAGQAPVDGTDAAADGPTGFRRAFALAITNPYQVVFWLTVGVGLLEPGRLDVFAHAPLPGVDLAGLLVVETGSPALLAGFFLGIGCWIVGFPAALRAAQRRVASVAPVVAAASALVLGGFGVVFLVDAVRSIT